MLNYQSNFTLKRRLKRSPMNYLDRIYFNVGFRIFFKRAFWQVSITNSVIWVRHIIREIVHICGGPISNIGFFVSYRRYFCTFNILPFFNILFSSVPDSLTRGKNLLSDVCVALALGKQSWNLSKWQINLSIWQSSSVLPLIFLCKYANRIEW